MPCRTTTPLVVLLSIIVVFSSISEAARVPRMYRTNTTTPTLSTSESFSQEASASKSPTEERSISKSFTLSQTPTVTPPPTSTSTSTLSLSISDTGASQSFSEEMSASKTLPTPSPSFSRFTGTSTLSMTLSASVTATITPPPTPTPTVTFSLSQSFSQSLSFTRSVTEELSSTKSRSFGTFTSSRTWTLSSSMTMSFGTLSTTLTMSTSRTQSPTFSISYTMSNSKLSASPSEEISSTQSVTATLSKSATPSPTVSLTISQSLTDSGLSTTRSEQLSKSKSRATQSLSEELSLSRSTSFSMTVTRLSVSSTPTSSLTEELSQTQSVTFSQRVTETLESLSISQSLTPSGPTLTLSGPTPTLTATLSTSSSRTQQVDLGFSQEVGYDLLVSSSVAFATTPPLTVSTSPVWRDFFTKVSTAITRVVAQAFGSDGAAFFESSRDVLYGIRAVVPIADSGEGEGLQLGQSALTPGLVRQLFGGGPLYWTIPLGIGFRGNFSSAAYRQNTELQRLRSALVDGGIPTPLLELGVVQLRAQPDPYPSPLVAFEGGGFWDSDNRWYRVCSTAAEITFSGASLLYPVVAGVGVWNQLSPAATKLVPLDDSITIASTQIYTERISKFNSRARFILSGLPVLQPITFRLTGRFFHFWNATFITLYRTPTLVVPPSSTQSSQLYYSPSSSVGSASFTLSSAVALNRFATKMFLSKWLISEVGSTLMGSSNSSSPPATSQPVQPASILSLYYRVTAAVRQGNGIASVGSDDGDTFVFVEGLGVVMVDVTVAPLLAGCGSVLTTSIRYDYPTAVSQSLSECSATSASTSTSNAGGTSSTCNSHGRCDSTGMTCLCDSSTSFGFWSSTDTVTTKDGTMTNPCATCLPGYSYTSGCKLLEDCASTCQRGTCSRDTLGQIQCLCYADPLRGYWAGVGCDRCDAKHVGVNCTVCLPGWYDHPTLLRNTDGSGNPSLNRVLACSVFCDPAVTCSGHGTCSVDANAGVRCACSASPDLGYWTGVSCNYCLPPFVLPSLSATPVDCARPCNSTLTCSGHGWCRSDPVSPTLRDALQISLCACFKSDRLGFWSETASRRSGYSGSLSELRYCSSCDTGFSSDGGCQFQQGKVTCDPTCKNGGVCSVSANGAGAKCVCAVNGTGRFQGTSCELCAFNPISGFWATSTSSGVCSSCADGYWGTDCTRVCPCSGHGRCSRTSGICSCFLSPDMGYWAGANCSTCRTGFVPLPLADASTSTAVPGQTYCATRCDCVFGECVGIDGSCRCFWNSTHGYFTGARCDQCGDRDFETGGVANFAINLIAANSRDACTACRPGFTGPRCNVSTIGCGIRLDASLGNGNSISLSSQSNLVCGGVGQCVVNGSSCTCPSGWTGSTCEVCASASCPRISLGDSKSLAECRAKADLATLRTIAFTNTFDAIDVTFSGPVELWPSASSSSASNSLPNGAFQCDRVLTTTTLSVVGPNSVCRLVSSVVLRILFDIAYVRRKLTSTATNPSNVRAATPSGLTIGVLLTLKDSTFGDSNCPANILGEVSGTLTAPTSSGSFPLTAVLENGVQLGATTVGPCTPIRLIATSSTVVSPLTTFQFVIDDIRLSSSVPTAGGGATLSGSLRSAMISSISDWLSAVPTNNPVVEIPVELSPAGFVYKFSLTVTDNFLGQSVFSPWLELERLGSSGLIAPALQWVAQAPPQTTVDQSLVWAVVASRQSCACLDNCTVGSSKLQYRWSIDPPGITTMEGKTPNELATSTTQLSLDPFAVPPGTCVYVAVSVREGVMGSETVLRASTCVAASPLLATISGSSKLTIGPQQSAVLQLNCQDPSFPISEAMNASWRCTGINGEDCPSGLPPLATWTSSPQSTGTGTLVLVATVKGSWLASGTSAFVLRGICATASRQSFASVEVIYSAQPPTHQMLVYSDNGGQAGPSTPISELLLSPAAPLTLVPRLFPVAPSASNVVVNGSLVDGRAAVPAAAVSWLWTTAPALPANAFGSTGFTSAVLSLLEGYLPSGGTLLVTVQAFNTTLSVNPNTGRPEPLQVLLASQSVTLLIASCPPRGQLVSSPRVVAAHPGEIKVTAVNWKLPEFDENRFDSMGWGYTTVVNNKRRSLQLQYRFRVRLESAEEVFLTPWGLQATTAVPTWMLAGAKLLANSNSGSNSLPSDTEVYATVLVDVRSVSTAADGSASVTGSSLCAQTASTGVQVLVSANSFVGTTSTRGRQSTASATAVLGVPSVPSLLEEGRFEWAVEVLRRYQYSMATSDALVALQGVAQQIRAPARSVSDFRSALAAWAVFDLISSSLQQTLCGSPLAQDLLRNTISSVQPIEATSGNVRNIIVGATDDARTTSLMLTSRGAGALLYCVNQQISNATATAVTSNRRQFSSTPAPSSGPIANNATTNTSFNMTTSAPTSNPTPAPVATVAPLIELANFSFPDFAPWLKQVATLVQTVTNASGSWLAPGQVTDEIGGGTSGLATDVSLQCSRLRTPYESDLTADLWTSNTLNVTHGLSTRTRVNPSLTIAPAPMNMSNTTDGIPFGSSSSSSLAAEALTIPTICSLRCTSQSSAVPNLFASAVVTSVAKNSSGVNESTADGVVDSLFKTLKQSTAKGSSVPFLYDAFLVSSSLQPSQSAASVDTNSKTSELEHCVVIRGLPQGAGCVLVDLLTLNSAADFALWATTRSENGGRCSLMVSNISTTVVQSGCKCCLDSSRPVGLLAVLPPSTMNNVIFERVTANPPVPPTPIITTSTPPEFPPLPEDPHYGLITSFLWVPFLILYLIGLVCTIVAARVGQRRFVTMLETHSLDPQEPDLVERSMKASQLTGCGKVVARLFGFHGWFGPWSQVHGIGSIGFHPAASLGLFHPLLLLATFLLVMALAGEETTSERLEVFLPGGSFEILRKGQSPWETYPESTSPFTPGIFVLTAFSTLFSICLALLFWGIGVKVLAIRAYRTWFSSAVAQLHLTRTKANGPRHKSIDATQADDAGDPKSLATVRFQQRLQHAAKAVISRSRIRMKPLEWVQETESIIEATHELDKGTDRSSTLPSLADLQRRQQQLRTHHVPTNVVPPDVEVIDRISPVDADPYALYEDVVASPREQLPVATVEPEPIGKPEFSHEESTAILPYQRPGASSGLQHGETSIHLPLTAAWIYEGAAHFDLPLAATIRTLAWNPQSQAIDYRNEHGTRSESGIRRAVLQAAQRYRHAAEENSPLDTIIKEELSAQRTSNPFWTAAAFCCDRIDQCRRRLTVLMDAPNDPKTERPKGTKRERRLYMDEAEVFHSVAANLFELGLLTSCPDLAVCWPTVLRQLVQSSFHHQFESRISHDVLSVTNFDQLIKSLVGCRRAGVQSGAESIGTAWCEMIQSTPRVQAQADPSTNAASEKARASHQLTVVITFLATHASIAQIMSNRVHTGSFALARQHLRQLALHLLERRRLLSTMTLEENLDSLEFCRKMLLQAVQILAFLPVQSLIAGLKSWEIQDWSEVADGGGGGNPPADGAHGTFDDVLNLLEAEEDLGRWTYNAVPSDALPGTAYLTAALLTTRLLARQWKQLIEVTPMDQFPTRKLPGAAGAQRPSRFEAERYAGDGSWVSDVYQLLTDPAAPMTIATEFLAHGEDGIDVGDASAWKQIADAFQVSHEHHSRSEDGKDRGSSKSLHRPANLVLREVLEAQLIEPADGQGELYPPLTTVTMNHVTPTPRHILQVLELLFRPADLDERHRRSKYEKGLSHKTGRLSELLVGTGSCLHPWLLLTTVVNENDLNSDFNSEDAGDERRSNVARNRRGGAKQQSDPLARDQANNNGAEGSHQFSLLALHPAVYLPIEWNGLRNVVVAPLTMLLDYAKPSSHVMNPSASPEPFDRALRRDVELLLANPGSSSDPFALPPGAEEQAPDPDELELEYVTGTGPSPDRHPGKRLPDRANAYQLSTRQEGEIGRSRSKIVRFGRIKFKDCCHVALTGVSVGYPQLWDPDVMTSETPARASSVASESGEIEPDGQRNVKRGSAVLCGKDTALSIVFGCNVALDRRFKFDRLPLWVPGPFSNGSGDSAAAAAAMAQPRNRAGPGTIWGIYYLLLVLIYLLIGGLSVYYVPRSGGNYGYRCRNVLCFRSIDATLMWCLTAAFGLIWQFIFFTVLSFLVSFLFL